MSLAVFERNIRIDKYETPSGSTFRQSEAERYREIVRMLKAWGISTTPARKKHRIPHRSTRKRIHFYWLWQSPQANLTPFKIEIVKTPDRRTSIEAELKSIFDRLSDLKTIEDVDDEYTLKPTPRAHSDMKVAIIDARDRMGEKFPLPRLVPDGDGGIVAAWSKGEKRVRLRIRPDKETRDYIYYQSEGEYDVESATNENLTKRLEWLLDE